MDKHEKLDETIEKMREASAAAGAATPPPDWGKLEQNVILRLVRQVKIGRLLVLALGTFIIGGIALLVCWRLFIPDIEHRKGEDEIVKWRVGQVQISQLPKTTSNKKKHEPSQYFLQDIVEPLSYQGCKFEIIKPSKPVLGSSYLAIIYREKEVYYFVLKEGGPPNGLCKEGVTIQGGEAHAARSFKDICRKMIAHKIWPVSLWRLYPAVKQISEGNFQLIAPGPFTGLATASKLYYGGESVYSLHASTWGNAFGFFSTDASLWPDRFVVADYEDGMALEGNKSGFIAYENVRHWGSGTLDYLAGCKEVLLWSELILPLSPDKLSSDFTLKLKQDFDVLLPQAPSLMKRASMQEIQTMLKPWLYNGREPTSEKKRNQFPRRDVAEVNGVVSGVQFSNPDEGELQLSRGRISIKFFSSFTKIGTAVDVLVDGKSRLKFEVRHEKPYPILNSTFDTKTEKLLSEAESIAKVVLAQPSASWPANTVPEPYLRSWLNAVVERKIVLHTEDYEVFAKSYVRWEGNDAYLLMRFGHQMAEDIELEIGNDGFTLHLQSSGSLLRYKADKLELMQAEGNSNEVLTQRERERLQAYIDSLRAYSKGEWVKPTPEMPSPWQGEPRATIPSETSTGIEKLAKFLENPKLPQAKRVKAVPAIEWGYDSMTKLEIAIAH
jgi:hypothetical protein